MSTVTFWHHMKSNTLFRSDEDVERVQNFFQDGSCHELVEAAWVQVFIAQCLLRRELPDGVDAILINATKHSLSAQPITNTYYLSGKVFLYPRFHEGFQIHTTVVTEELPGGIFKTRGKTYLCQPNISKRAPTETVIGYTPDGIGA